MKLKMNFNLLRDMSVGRKFAALFGLMVTGYALVGVGYYASLRAEEAASEEVKRHHEFAADVDKLRIDILNAQQKAQAFIQTRRHGHAEQFQQIVTEALQDLAQSQKKTSDERELKLSSEIAQAVTDFREDFRIIVANQEQLGLDENSGLHGKMRKPVHAVEEDVKRTQQLPLEVSLLMLRRHEKDFIQREEEKYLNRHAAEYENFVKLLEGSRLPDSVKAEAANNIKAYQQAFADFTRLTLELNQTVVALNQGLAKINPLMGELDQLKDENLAAISLASEARHQRTVIFFAVGMLLIVGLVSGLGYLITRGIAGPVRRLRDTVHKLAEGDQEARVQLDSKDELGELGLAFDDMIDARVATQMTIQKENEQLNDSVLALLQAVAQLSKRDLTVKVPVTEDVTGPVADALNLLTGETAKVLKRVSDISADVSSASLKVKSQSEAVAGVAETERQQVDKTAQELAAAAQAMNKIAQLAQSCNAAADNAIKTTQTALTTVNATVGGINVTRDTIRETEARIKRLGERSQEISGAVNLINNIAERTHILALNASMHAASAGEAGRGFAVVADEVQRLAESARQATEQIASLVSNIQVETGDTVSTMNAAITQVAEGAKLAEQAGEEMKRTQQTTAELVASVQQIAASSQQQAQASNDLLKRAAEIRKSTQATSQQLAEQTKQTESLVEYAKNLISAVRVFKLPA